MATVGVGLFALVAVTSIKAARRRLSYETWYGLHLYAYLAIALAFLHQLFVGADFMHDQLAAIYWIVLYLATAALVLAFRIGQPIRTSIRHRLRVAIVIREAPGVVSLYLTGRDLDRAGRPRRPVLPRASSPVTAGGAPPVLDLVRAERPLAPVHRQGPRRRRRATSPTSRSGPGSLSKAPTACSPRHAGEERGPSSQEASGSRRCGR